MIEASAIRDGPTGQKENRDERQTSIYIKSSAWSLVLEAKVLFLELYIRD